MSNHKPHAQLMTTAQSWDTPITPKDARALSFQRFKLDPKWGKIYKFNFEECTVKVPRDLIETWPQFNNHSLCRVPYYATPYMLTVSLDEFVAFAIAYDAAPVETRDKSWKSETDARRKAEWDAGEPEREVAWAKYHIAMDEYYKQRCKGWQAFLHQNPIADLIGETTWDAFWGKSKISEPLMPGEKEPDYEGLRRLREKSDEDARKDTAEYRERQRLYIEKEKEKVAAWDETHPTEKEEPPIKKKSAWREFFGL